MDQDITWYGGRPRHRGYCVRWGPSSPHGNGHGSPPHFQSMSIVAKQLPISVTAELLLLLPGNGWLAGSWLVKNDEGSW